MADDLQQRLAVASQCLLQSPPGEVDDVFSDVRAIVSDDSAFEAGILPALQQYNTEQFITADLEGSKVLITEVSKVKGDEEERHVDPRGQRTFVFDHMKIVASDPQPLPVNDETEAIRAGLDKVLSAHVTNHYSEGASAVYALEDSNYPEPEPEPAAVSEPTAESEPVSEPEVVVNTSAGEEEKSAEAAAAEAEGDEGVESDDKVEEGEKVDSDNTAQVDPTTAAEPALESADDEPTAMETTPTPPAPPTPRPSRLFGLYFVGTKYNPSNYWTGKWRSVYVADLAKGTLEGKARVNVHYYEQGNVQLSTTLLSTNSLPSSTPSPEEVVALIKSSESSFASQLSEAYSSLSDEQFKGLRRALPRTRTKVDWAKISAYKLSKELGGAEGE